ncbi:MAG: NADH-quinone oxidoreductase subunit L, partial [Pseudoxanthomonas suwonensis]|nr:NADH-quinone oxidoreductase subunit L [Pseudoxanthomonas suwonensis]
FLLGIAAVLYWFGTLDYATVFANASDRVGGGQMVEIIPGIQWHVATLICICLFIGAMGKSAQVPLHVWLPDSMEGPTPISALIHAATMVTAGIFMVARMSPLFELSTTALAFVLFIGATTAFWTGLIGMVQNDIKRVVAYSTLSQLGYMTVALGVSAYSAGVYHLMTHAFFKALLFLGAGSVIIGMHHEQDMRRMGGLRKYMPITYWTMLLGTLALIGTPFFSGFYSKDTIIEAAKLAAGERGWVGTYGYWAVLLGAFVTSFYSFRLLYLTFFGPERFRDVPAHDGHGVHEPHESPWVVTVPLVLLAIPSVLIGFFTVGPMLFGTDWTGKAQQLPFFLGAIDLQAANDTVLQLKDSLWQHGPVGFATHGFVAPAFWLTLAGFALATLMYVFKPELPAKAAQVLALPKRILEEKYGMDTLWIKGLAGGGVALGKVSRLFDTKVIDGLFVNGSARLVDLAAGVLRRTQSGYLYHYAFAMILGLIALLAVVMHYWR